MEGHGTLAVRLLALFSVCVGHPVSLGVVNTCQTSLSIIFSLCFFVVYVPVVHILVAIGSYMPKEVVFLLGIQYQSIQSVHRFLQRMLWSIVICIGVGFTTVLVCILRESSFVVPLPGACHLAFVLIRPGRNAWGIFNIIIPGQRACAIGIECVYFLP